MQAVRRIGLEGDRVRYDVAAEPIGIQGILVHVILEEAEAFHRAVGFDSSPLDPMTFMVTLADLRRSIQVGRRPGRRHRPQMHRRGVAQSEP